MTTSGPDERRALERLLFFSDAVFAIAITLLVVEIRLPPLPPGTGEAALGRALVSLIPVFVGFVFSFFLIAQTWIEHHRMGRLLLGYDLGLLWRNALVLFFVAFMPFATVVLSEDLGLRLASAQYAATFGGLGLAKAAFWRHAMRRGLVEGDSAEVRSISRRVWATPLTSAAVLLVTAAGLPGACAGFGLIPLVARLLDRQPRAAPAPAPAAGEPADTTG